MAGERIHGPIEAIQQRADGDHVSITGAETGGAYTVRCCTGAATPSGS
jgi:hypothetical protein